MADSLIYSNSTQLPASNRAELGEEAYARFQVSKSLGNKCCNTCVLRGLVHSKTRFRFPKGAKPFRQDISFAQDYLITFKELHTCQLLDESSFNRIDFYLKFLSSFVISIFRTISLPHSCLLGFSCRSTSFSIVNSLLAIIT
ncbi:hypothetical protein VNO80_19549 [Phaseolus coccineus]|uniref:Uncharacterized protein n=1 Tax=Phaseolus coccineus TaxID=3886 RepID=A0AAN9MGB9_PHACN